MPGRKLFSPKVMHEVNLDERVPHDHLLRRIAEVVDFSFVWRLTVRFYSHTGQPGIDPEVLFKMALVGYLYGITSERRLAEELRLHLACMWFVGYEWRGFSPLLAYGRLAPRSPGMQARAVPLDEPLLAGASSAPIPVWGAHSSRSVPGRVTAGDAPRGWTMSVPCVDRRGAAHVRRALKTLPGGSFTLVGRPVARLGFGAMQLARPGGRPAPTRDTALAVLRRAVALGVNQDAAAHPSRDLVAKPVVAHDDAVALCGTWLRECSTKADALVLDDYITSGLPAAGDVPAD